MAGLPQWVGYLLSALAGAAILVIAFKLVAPSRQGPRIGKDRG
ncbi:MAG: hypothetical protein WCL50_08705 [Spirochaetota bacterium]